MLPLVHPQGAQADGVVDGPGVLAAQPGLGALPKPQLHQLRGRRGEGLRLYLAPVAAQGGAGFVLPPVSTGDSQGFRVSPEGATVPALGVAQLAQGVLLVLLQGGDDEGALEHLVVPQGVPAVD